MSEKLTPKVFVDDLGHAFSYIHIDNGTQRLGVHFSAFFGERGEHPKYRTTFGGYFHRLKMLSQDQSRDWLFLCDPYGLESNGTYYVGSVGDPFVEQAMRQIIETVGVGSRYAVGNVITIGSSMGSTGAIKFGIEFGVKGIVAIAPHVDLDVCARLTGRYEHVRWILNGADPYDHEFYPTTRRIRDLIHHNAELPDLFVQSSINDPGVYKEQVLPLIIDWRRNGGQATLDRRLSGGHTSRFATQELLLDVVARLERGSKPPVLLYQALPRFRPRIESDAFKNVVGHVAKKLLKRPKPPN